MGTNKLKIAITFDPALLKRVDAAAAGLAVSRSAFIEKAVLSVLEESEQVASAMGNVVVRDAFFEAFKQPGVLKALAESMGAQLAPHELHKAKGIMDAIQGDTKKPSRRPKKGKG